MTLEAQSLKVIADGLAKKVFDSKVTLTVDTVDQFIRTDEIVKLLISTGQVNSFELKIIKKYFEENNPFAYVIAKTAQVTASDYKPWLHGQRLSEIDWSNHERLHKFLQNYRNFNPNILLEIAKESRDIIDLCGDPKSEGNWLRKGLIFGYVQSGKTTSYSDVIARGIDAGYKVFIVLAGTTNSLRRQTQERMEENVIGQISQRPGTYANIIEPLKALHAMTRELDFNKTRDQVLNFNHEVGTIFIIKKNVSVLRSLLEEIDRIRGSNKINLPMLLIDDEADNATINTASKKGSKNNITSINKGIRDILNCFTKRVYLGYTATPFANIFIDHKSDADLELIAKSGKDLFPSDFIKSISAPNFYVGAQRLFHPDDETPKNSLQHTVGIIRRENYNPILPLKHKKSDSETLDTLPSSLHTAVKYFFLFCAIEKARGRWGKHHTMMINVSRFNAVQDSIELEVTNFCKVLRNSIKMAAGNLTLADDVFNSLKQLYKNGVPANQIMFPNVGSSEIPYDKCEETDGLDFNQNIAPALNEICDEIFVQTVNMQKKSLEYPDTDYKHVIAIGGLALSRGLTLEGLVITYILRNASASDTLMQMGRWFGYRLGYENLTRIFMPQSSFDHYSSIHLATEELREELEQMSYVKQTPVEFGLKVRNSETGIMITARNKLQSAETITVSKDFSLKHKQAFILCTDRKIRDHNENLLKKFVETLLRHSEVKECPLGYTFAASGQDVLRLISDLDFKGSPDFSSQVSTTQAEKKSDFSFIEQYIRRRVSESLKIWRICIPKGSKKLKKMNLSSPISLHRRSRSKGYPIASDRFKVTKKDSVALGEDLEIGVSDEDLAKLSGRGTKGSQIANFLGAPTLYLHFLDVVVVDDQDQYNALNFNGTYSSISILFNGSEIASDQHTYTANQVLLQQRSNNQNDYDDDDDDDDDYAALDGEI